MADKSSMKASDGQPPPQPSVEDPGANPNGKRKWLVLVAMVFGLFMPMLDNLVVNVALPTMQRELDAQVSDLQWIIDAYTLTFASLMLVGGSLGDLYGRKKFFMLGLVVFTAGSLACGLSETTEQLIGFRALQGLGAALLLPGSLSIITATFHGRERGTAIGIWAAMSGLAVAVGPLVGGYIVEHYSWETIFFINLPVGLLGFLLTGIVVRETRDTSTDRRIDVPGLLTGTAGLFFLVYALIEGGVEGWTDDVILGSFALAAVLLLLFVVIELKRKSPMLPLHFFRNPTFAASNVVAASVFFALFGTTFFLALYLQNVRGFSPLETGVRLLPFTAAILVIAPVAGRLSDKHGSRWLMTLGTLYAAGGMALLLRIEPDSAYESIILPAFIVLGSGMALTMAPMTAAVMGSVHPRHAGVASATTNTTRELGGVLGIALLGALVTDTFKDRLLDTLTSVGLNPNTAGEVVERAAGNAAAGGGTVESFSQQLPPGTPATVVAQIASGAQQAFVDAIHSGLLVGVGFLLLASLVSAIFVRSHVGAEHPAEPQTPKQRRKAGVAQAAPAAGGPQIDARTEQVLREALEPVEAEPLPAGPSVEPLPGEAEAEPLSGAPGAEPLPAEAAAEPLPAEAEPAAASLADAGAATTTPPVVQDRSSAALETVEMPAAEVLAGPPDAEAGRGPSDAGTSEERGDAGLAEKPAEPPRRRPRRKAGDVMPVAMTDTHYHPEEPAGAGNGWVPEGETLDATDATEAYYRLRHLLVELPIKAGTGEVEDNLQEVSLATLSYYQYGLSQPGGDALPVGVTNGAQSSIREDIGVLAGYLDLEKRFGRIPVSLDSEQAASALMAALASRALEGGAGTGNGEFVRRTLQGVLHGEEDVPAPVPPSPEPAEQSGSSERVVYRRRWKDPGAGG